MFRLKSMIMLMSCAITACGSLEAPVVGQIEFGVSLPPPAGLVEFCQGSEILCESGSILETAPVSTIYLTSERFKHIRDINYFVNISLRPQTDKENYGESEKWTLPLSFGLSGTGDCEDYALEKRIRLIDAGFPESGLLLAIARTVSGNFHAILVVRTDHGDLVLDNTTDSIMGWREKSYIWGAIQKPGKMLDWAQIWLGHPGA